MREAYQQILDASVKWLEGPGQSADPKEFFDVLIGAMKVAQLLEAQKETARVAILHKEAV